MTPPNSAKYGSRDETTFRFTKTMRGRMRIVAAHSDMKMNAWLEKKIIEDEKKFGIVPLIEGVDCDGPAQA